MKAPLYFVNFLFALILPAWTPTNAQCPDWLWVNSIGSIGNDHIQSIAVESESGFIYTAGSFQGTVDFDPGEGTFNLTAKGNNDVFISKFAPAGNLVWAKAIGGSDVAFVNTITLDPADAGNVYLAGIFNGIVDFDPGQSTFNLNSMNYPAIFISKLDEDGNFSWAKAIRGSVANDILSMEVDRNGNIYTTGHFRETVDFDPDSLTSFNLNSHGDLDMFISKLDGSGKFIWAKQLGGTGSDVSRCIALDPGRNGEIYTTGWFSGTVDFDPGPNSHPITSVGHFDIFISKLDHSGNLIWAKQLGGSGDKDGSGSSIAIDPASGDVYTTGYFEGTADFDPDKGIFNLTSSGLRDIFVSKLDNLGNFEWAKSMGGTGLDIGRSIAFDPAEGGNVYIAGSYQSLADFDPGDANFNLTSIGNDAIFISKLNGSGNFIWAKSISGKEDAAAVSLSLDAIGHVHVAGFYNGPILSFGSAIEPNAGNYDLFVAKLDVTKPQATSGIQPASIIIYPNPTKDKVIITTNDILPGLLNMMVFSLGGEVVFSGSANHNLPEYIFDISGLPAGVYYVAVTLHGERWVKQVVKTQE